MLLRTSNRPSQQLRKRERNFLPAFIQGDPSHANVPVDEESVQPMTMPNFAAPVSTNWAVNR